MRWKQNIVRGILFCIAMVPVFGFAQQSGSSEIDQFAEELLLMIQQAADTTVQTQSNSSTIAEKFVIDPVAGKMRLSDNEFPKRIVWGVLLGSTQSAVDYLYQNGLTKFATEAGFLVDLSLRRDEAAAFFGRFAKNIRGMIPDTSKPACTSFSDAGEGHTDLKAIVIESCQLWLFKGSEGRFMPTTMLTNAQAITVLMRLINWSESEQTDWHRAKNYYLLAKKMGLLKGLAANDGSKLDEEISRGDIARMLEAASLVLFVKETLGVDSLHDLETAFTSVEAGYQR